MDNKEEKKAPAIPDEHAESVKYFKMLTAIRDLMLKAYPIDQEHESYLELRRIKNKAVEAIKNKVEGYSKKLQIYENELEQFVEISDKNLFDDTIAKWKEKNKFGKYNKDGSIETGYFWIYLKEILKARINKSNKEEDKKNENKKESEEAKEKLRKLLKEECKEKKPKNIDEDILKLIKKDKDARKNINFENKIKYNGEEDKKSNELKQNEIEKKLNLDQKENKNDMWYFNEKDQINDREYIYQNFDKLAINFIKENNDEESLPIVNCIKAFIYL